MGKSFMSCETNPVDVVKEQALLRYIYDKACANKMIRDIWPGLNPMSVFHVQLTKQPQLLLVHD